MPTPAERAERICEGLSGPLREQVMALAEHVCFLQDKLEAERDLVANQHAVMTMTVGDRAPHKVVRANPAWRGYTDMLRAYSAALMQLDALLGRARDGQDDSELADMRRSVGRFRLSA